MDKIENIRANVAKENPAVLQLALKKMGISYTVDGIRKIITGWTVEPRPTVLDGICKILNLDPLTGLSADPNQSENESVSAPAPRINSIVSIPGLGNIKAGKSPRRPYAGPVQMSPDLFASITKNAPPAECFAIRVEGEKLYPQYQDTDVLIVSRVATSGTIVLPDGEKLWLVLRDDPGTPIPNAAGRVIGLLRTEG